MTRGYSMLASWKYVDSTYDATTKQAIVDQLSPEVQQALGTYKEIEFYPVQHWSEILRGIATVVGKTDAKAEQELVACGTFIATEATNTFLRLLMRVLTPNLFAKKIPSLWTRDNTAGSFSVDLSAADAGRYTFKLTGVDGYPYCGPVAMGWIAFAMKSMGCRTKSLKLSSSWSLANPGPNELSIELELEGS